MTASALTLLVQLILLLAVGSSLVSALGGAFGTLFGVAVYALVVFVWIKLIQRFLVR